MNARLSLWARIQLLGILVIANRDHYMRDGAVCELTVGEYITCDNISVRDSARLVLWALKEGPV